MEPSKNIVWSKTFWFNALSLAVAVVAALMEDDFVRQNPDLVKAFGLFLTVGNIIIRYWTKQAIHIMPQPPEEFPPGYHQGCWILPLLGLLFLGNTCYAADKFGDHQKINLVVFQGKYHLLTGDPATGNVAIHPVTVSIQHLDGTTPIDPVNPPPPIPTPSGTILETVKSATTAVPAYAGKDTDQRMMAFTLSLLAQSAGSAPVAQTRVAAKQFADAAVGANAPKWETWWATVNAKLEQSQLTPSTMVQALNDMAAGLTSNLTFSADEKTVMGVSTFGLDPALLAKLVALILPMIMEWLSQLFKQSMIFPM